MSEAASRVSPFPARLEAFVQAMPGPPPRGPARSWAMMQALGGGRAPKAMSNTFSLEPVAEPGGWRLHIHQMTPILYGVAEEVQGELRVRDDLLRTPLSWHTQCTIRRGVKAYPQSPVSTGSGELAERQLRWDGRTRKLPPGELTSTWSLLAGLPGLVDRSEAVGPFAFLDELTLLHEEVRLARAPERPRLPWGEVAALWRMWGPTLPTRYLYLSENGDLLVFASVSKCYWAVGP